MDLSSLTQSEAEERGALLTVAGYDIEMDLTDLPTGPAVRCTSTVRFSCARPGASSFVDCCPEVVSATLNGVALPRAVRGRIALADLAADNELVVSSVQEDTTAGPGVHKSTDPSDGEVYLWTSFEPDEARFAYACFDQPDLKAPHVYTVLAPAAWTVLSNSADPVVTEEGDARRWAFPATPPLSTYNPTVLAGPFHEIRREAGGFDLGVYARRSMTQILERDADNILTVTEQGLAFFGEIFAMPFPQRKYDQVFLPEFGGAMENYGCVAWSDYYLPRSAPTFADEEYRARVILHEMAHMWFGNIVTMRWWDDLWLNEAFAEFAAHWAGVRGTAYTDLWTTHLVTGSLQAYRADQGPTAHPIVQPIEDVARAASIFDAITYPKGASVLLQLMTYLGEDTFEAGMRAYFARHAWGNTVLTDLLDALAEASGRDLDRWRRVWLETAGPDRLVLEEDGATLLRATGPGGAPPRPHVLDIGSYGAGSDGGWELVATTRVEVDGEVTPLELPEADVHVVNDNDLTYAVTRPSAPTRDAFVARTPDLPTPIGRAVGVATVYDMLYAGEASTEEVVGMLVAVLRRETSPSVVEPYLELAAGLSEHWTGDAVRGALQEEVAALCRDLAQDDRWRQVALRTLARTGSDAAELASLGRTADGDTALLWRVLARRAELGEVVTSDVESLLSRDGDPDAWVSALAVQASSPQPDDKEAAWTTLAVDRKVPVSGVREVGVTFWRPGQDEVLAPYAGRYLEMVSTFDRSGMIPAMTYSRSLFPLHGIDEAFVDLAEQQTRGSAPVVRKEMLERGDLVRRMLAARQAGSGR